jgi:iron-sulfur cluster assembly accessory protein
MIGNRHVANATCLFASPAAPHNPLIQLPVAFGKSVAINESRSAFETETVRHLEGKMIALTESAAGAIRSAIGATATPIAGLRVTAAAGGCSGYQYQMGLVESADPGDLQCESQGLQIFTDPDSAGRLTGTTIDFIQSLEDAGFSFNNPQAKSTCGCGKSFC